MRKNPVVGHMVYPCLSHSMIKILTFIFFCINFVLISGSEMLQDDKELYKELLSELSLTRALLASIIVPSGDVLIREARDSLWMALNGYEMILKSDNVIFKFCGSIERVEGEKPGHRAFKIFKRDTRNPFAETTDVKRLIKRRELKFRKGTQEQNSDKYNDLMDRDLVHFSFDKNFRTFDLDAVIMARNIEKVKELVKEEFIKQGGVLESDRINFSLRGFRSHGAILDIDGISYQYIFVHLNDIIF